MHCARQVCCMQNVQALSHCLQVRFSALEYYYSGTTSYRRCSKPHIHCFHLCLYRYACSCILSQPLVLLQIIIIQLKKCKLLTVQTYAILLEHFSFSMQVGTNISGKNAKTTTLSQVIFEVPTNRTFVEISLQKTHMEKKKGIYGMATLCEIIL